MEELAAIKLLHEVLLGEQRDQLSPNSVQRQKTSQRVVPPQQVAVTPPATSPTATPINDIPDDDDALPALVPNYVSDDEDDDYEPTINHRARRSNRVMQRHSASTHTGPNCLAALGIAPLTGSERLSDTVHFQYHAIPILDLNPADKILEATRQLDDAICQQPRRVPMEELTAIELLRKVLLGEQRVHLHPNSVQLRKTNQQTVPPQRVAVTPPATSPTATPSDDISDDDNALPALVPEYVSDNEDNNYEPTINHRARRSKQIMRRQSVPTHTGPNRIAALAASKTASVPDLTVQQRKLTRGFGRANLDLQMKEWAFEENFAGVVIDEDTGKALEYRHLIKHPKHKDVWETSLSNEFGRLAQGIRDIPGTDTIFFISKSEIPKD